MNLFSNLKKSAPVRRTLPKVVLRQVNEFLQGSFVAPNLWIKVEGLTPDGSAVVAQVGYGVSPLRDRIYVDVLNVEPQYRRRGYASSLLLAIAQQCSNSDQLLSVTALCEVESSTLFWQSLRDGIVPSLVVTTDLQGNEIDAEKQRWLLSQI